MAFAEPQNTDAAASDVSLTLDATSPTFDPNSGSAWRNRIDRCIQEKKHHLVNEWADSVDYRRGKPFGVDSDSDRINVNLDWSLTKSKQAGIASQVPTVYLTAKRNELRPAVAKFGKEVNTRLKTAGLGTALYESSVDVINAAGIGVILTSVKTTTQEKQVPQTDPSQLPPDQQAALMAGQFEIPMVTVQDVIDREYRCARVSPADFLWPLEFTGSDFEDADWIGHTDRMFWSEAQREFKLTDEQRAEVMGQRDKDETLRQDDQTMVAGVEPVVTYHELFYWAIRYVPGETFFKRINRIVFVDGIDGPVIHEPWKGQEFDQQSGKLIGSMRRPLQVLTLSYISDDAIPPSDSAIGRPQVKEIIKSRTQIYENRERSKPLRWFDVNRVDPMIQDNLMRGTWQGMIPVIGKGDDIIGEVARANYPREEFDFDRVAKADLQEQWQTGPNQQGAFASGPRSAHEASIVQDNFETRIGVERGRVEELIVRVAEIIAGYVALYDSFDMLTPQEVQALGQSWDYKHLAGEFSYWVRPDSTVLLTASQRIDKLEKLLNLVGKSGFVNPQPLIEELVALHGVDPGNVMVNPQPQEPAQPNISYRFSGDDLVNPTVIAMLIKAGQAPSPEEMAAAKQLLQQAYGQNAPTPPPPDQRIPSTPSPAPGADARPDWTPMPRVTKRINEAGG